MYYYFDDEISTESVNNLVEKLNEVEENKKITLYFTTHGGESSCMSFLIEYLNSIKDRLEIVFTFKCWSAGTYLLIYYQGKMRIDLDEMDSFLFHKTDRKMYVGGNNNRNVESLKRIKHQDEEGNINFANKLKKKGLLTDKQMQRYLNGKDVIVYKKQFKEWSLC